MLSILDIDAVRKANVQTEPYPFVLGANFLKPDAVGGLRESFPAITKPGFLTVDEVALKGRFKALIDELEGPELTAVLSEKFGFDLSPYPRLTTIRKLSQLKDGSIHTDGKSKVMTLLLYMNDGWQAAEQGRLRVLYNGKDFEPYAAEVPPTMGTVFVFLRSDNSWHGHLPFAGERRVVQVAWIRDAQELERKKKRNRTAQFWKNWVAEAPSATGFGLRSLLIFGAVAILACLSLLTARDAPDVLSRLAHLHGPSTIHAH